MNHIIVASMNGFIIVIHIYICIGYRCLD